MNPRRHLSQALVGALIVLAAWYLGAALLQRPIVPWPHRVALELARLVQRGRIMVDALASLARVLAGLALSIVLGTPLGLVMGRSVRAGSVIKPVVYLLFPLPKIALLPIFLALFGLGNLSKVILLFTIVVFHVMIAVGDSVTHIPREYFFATRLLGLNRFQQYKHLVLPGVLPALFSSVKLATGISLSVLFFAENFATRYGLGAFVMNAWIMADYPGIYAGIVVLGLMGFSLFLVIDLVAWLTIPSLRIASFHE